MLGSLLKRVKVQTLTPAQNSQSSNAEPGPPLTRIARLPGMRALAWSRNVLYASRGYELVRAHIEAPFQVPKWESVAQYRPNWKRELSVQSALTARLFRDGFHALSVLPSGGLIAAVPAAILTLCPGDAEFGPTHSIVRGTRPLHITAVPAGAIYWGEYFDNPARDEVHIYGSHDAGVTWSVAYTFPKGAVRHVHNIVHDPWEDCLWVFTGDYGDECRILRVTCDFSQVEAVLQGKQQTRAVAAIVTEEGLYFASDTPLEPNFIYRLDRAGTLTCLSSITGSSIYGCRVGRRLFFSTMVEPSEVNRDRRVQVYSTIVSDPAGWQPLLSWPKDRWPMSLFQYGNAFLPDGNNLTPYLAVSTIAVEDDDMATSLYVLS